MKKPNEKQWQIIFQEGAACCLLQDGIAYDRKKMAAGKGTGYERWAKIFNLKEAAKTLNFLVENNLTDYNELAARAEQAGDRFDEVISIIKIKGIFEFYWRCRLGNS